MIMIIEEPEKKEERCYMLTAGMCSADIDRITCGSSCPFYKTEEEQRMAEEKIVKRFREINWYGTYRSCINGEILYRNVGKGKH